MFFVIGNESILSRNEFCSTNIKIRYINTIPVDVANDANDEPISVAIAGRFGIKSMSNSKPVFSDIKFENINSFCCNIGVALYSSINIGFIRVANINRNTATVVSANIIDKQSKAIAENLLLHDLVI